MHGASRAGAHLCEANLLYADITETSGSLLVTLTINGEKLWYCLPDAVNMHHR